MYISILFAESNRFFFYLSSKTEKKILDEITAVCFKYIFFHLGKNFLIHFLQRAKYYYSNNIIYNILLIINIIYKYELLNYSFFNYIINCMDIIVSSF